MKMVGLLLKNIIDIFMFMKLMNLILMIIKFINTKIIIEFIIIKQKK